MNSASGPAVTISLLATSASPQTDELIYSVNRTPEPMFQTARATEVITSEEIRRQNARTLPELLMVAGVFVQQTNYGGGSPIMEQIAITTQYDIESRKKLVRHIAGMSGGDREACNC